MCDAALPRTLQWMPTAPLRPAAGRTCVLGLATGSTPMHVYRELVRMHRCALAGCGHAEAASMPSSVPRHDVSGHEACDVCAAPMTHDAALPFPATPLHALPPSVAIASTCYVSVSRHPSHRSAPPLLPVLAAGRKACPSSTW